MQFSIRCRSKGNRYHQCTDALWRKHKLQTRIPPIKIVHCLIVFALRSSAHGDASVDFVKQAQVDAVISGAHRIGIQCHYKQGIASGAQGCQHSVVGHIQKAPAGLYELGKLLTYVKVFDFPIALILKTSPDGTPLIVVFFHVLPVYPGFGPYVADVVDKLLCQAQVAGQAAASRTHLAHPESNILCRG